MRISKPNPKPEATEAPVRKKMSISPTAAAMAGIKTDYRNLASSGFTLQQTFSLPEVPRGVVPSQNKLAMDNAFAPYQDYGYDSMFSEGLGFLGYPYLAQLSQRAEYRKPAEIIAEEMTRKFIEFKAVGEEDKADKITELEKEFKRLRVKEVFAKCAEYDCYYGRAQIFIDLGNQDPQELQTKLVASTAKVRKKGIKRLRPVEPYWTYPSDYDSTNPLADDFFIPKSWFVMGKQIHASRFLNFVARPVSDILKPVYNFGGLSLTQILKPYVDNWLRTRQSVSDLLYSFSINVLKTNMDSILQGGGGEDVGLRVDIFNKYRDNRGCFVLDKDSEDFMNVSSPLGTLDKLQAQSQEQMASAAGIPLIILLKITPSGLNASSDGEIRSFNDWIESQQVSLFGPQLDKLMPIIQLNLWGEVDPDITYEFVSLNAKDEMNDANVRKVEADTDVELINAGVLDPTEVRTRLAQQEDSPYAGLDLSVVPEVPGMEGGLEGIEGMGEEDLLGELSPEGFGELPSEEDEPGMDGGVGSGIKGHTTPHDDARKSYKTSKGTDPVINAALTKISGVKIACPKDLTDEVNEAVAHLAEDKVLLPLLKGIKIEVKDMGKLYGNNSGDRIYVDEKTVREQGPGFASSIIRHELEHKILTEKGVPSGQQETQVRDATRGWAYLKAGSMAKTNPKAANGFEAAAKLNIKER